MNMMELSGILFDFRNELPQPPPPTPPTPLAHLLRIVRVSDREYVRFDCGLVDTAPNVLDGEFRALQSCPPLDVVLQRTASED